MSLCLNCCISSLVAHELVCEWSFLLGLGLYITMIASGDQNQFPSSFVHLGDLLKVLMFLSNLNGFNSSPSSMDQGFAKWKSSSKVWKEKGSKWFSYFFSLFLFLFVHYLCVWLSCFCVSPVLCYALFNMFLFVCFQFLLYFFFKKKIEKS